MQLTSPAFENDQPLSIKYTCYGDSVSPPFEISGVPEGARSLAFIMHDPDAPDGTFIHYVAWNINPAITTLEEGKLPAATYGLNSNNELRYFAACPPRHTGVHRYVYTLTALDNIPELPPGSGLQQLLQVMHGHVLAQAQLVGIFSIDPYLERLNIKTR